MQVYAQRRPEALLPAHRSHAPDLLLGNGWDTIPRYSFTTSVTCYARRHQ